MKDFTGKTIKVGSKVALIHHKRRELVTGTVIKLTPKTAEVEYLADQRWDACMKELVTETEVKRQLHSQLIVIQ